MKPNCPKCQKDNVNWIKPLNGREYDLWKCEDCEHKFCAGKFYLEIVFPYQKYIVGVVLAENEFEAKKRLNTDKIKGANIVIKKKQLTQACFYDKEFDDYLIRRN